MFNRVNSLSKYWLFQSLGWGLFIAINLFFVFTYDIVNQASLIRLATYVIQGILITHLMRKLYGVIRWLSRPINLQLIGFVIFSFAFGLIFGLLDYLIIVQFSLETPQDLKLSVWQKISANAFNAISVIFIWNCIYFIYHYVAQARQNQLDNLKLEALVKSLELKTIKSHINPHFIFNALNSIRALIDEDPVRARKAITALSNILRSSMISDQQELITLEKEMDIVKDYLDLELIRFEDRLKVTYEIDEETLDHPIPPMMLQTLVENAIKHGISKSITSGEIRIASADQLSSYHLSVVNTGKLSSTSDKEGFGLQSTSNRLSLLFGDRATFRIEQKDEQFVEANLSIPLT